jgi:ribosome biogenesis GTPase
LHAIRAAPAHPIVVLNKADLCLDADEQALRLARELHGVDVVAVSARAEQGMDVLRDRIGRDTCVLVGSSGVGKSSITNRLLGDDTQRVEGVRDNDTRGRHTTTHRQLFVLPSGALLIDTPGMREFGLFADDETELALTGFDEVDALAPECRFRDCQHLNEPGCAVLAAVSSGQLEASRLEHAQRLRRELEWQQGRTDQRQRATQKKAFRALSRAVRAGQRRKGHE